MKNHKKILFILLSFPLSIFFISCFSGSYGTKGLIPHNVDNIIENKTTYKDMVRMYGYPKSIGENRQMFIFDNKGLKNYLYGYTLKKYDFPEGEYEVWRYFNYYRGAGVGWVKHKRQDLIIVYNKKGIVINKYFSNVTTRETIGGETQMPPPPDFK